MAGTKTTAEVKNKNFSTFMSQEDAFNLLNNILPTLRLKNLKVKKMVKFSYLVVEYKEGFAEKGEIEFCFTTRQTKTDFSLKWSYPSKSDEESIEEGDFEVEEIVGVVTSIFSNLSRLGKTSRNYEQLIEELRLKMNAAELVSCQNYKDNPVPMGVIVRIRCRACLEVYDEILKECPRCHLADNR